MWQTFLKCFWFNAGDWKLVPGGKTTETLLIKHEAVKKNLFIFSLPHFYNFLQNITLKIFIGEHLLTAVS